MKKFLTIVGMLFLVVAIIAVLAAKFLAEPQLKILIEQKGSEAVSGQLTVGQLHLSFWPPISIVLQDINIKSPKNFNLSAQIKAARVSIDYQNLFKFKVMAHIEVDEPHVALDLPTVPEEPVSPPRPAKGSVTFNLKQVKAPLGLQALIKKGEFTIHKGTESYSSTKLDLNFTAPAMMVPWTLDIRTGLNLPGLPQVDLPVQVSSLFLYDGESIESSKIEFSVAGLKGDLKGKSTLSTEDHRWDANLNVADLSQIPIPEGLVKDIQLWKGAVNGKAHVEHIKNSPWRANGNLQVQSVTTQLNVEGPGSHIQGEVSVNSFVDFAYQDGLTLNKLLATGDLKNLSIQNSKMTKPKGYVASFDVAADGTKNTVNLSKGEVALGPIKLMAQGLVNNSPGGQSNLQIRVPSARLDGLEKIFPPLSSHPLTGRIELSGSLKGDLQNPKTLNISLNPLTLENVRGGLDWTSEDKTKKVKGPLSVNGKIVLVAQGEKLLSAAVNLVSDLSDLDVSMADQFQKRSHVPLKVDLKAKQKGQALQILQGLLSTAAGNIDVKGRIQDPSQPKMDLKFNASKVNLAVLSKLLPKLEPWGVGGVAQGRFSIQGAYDIKGGLEKSPLSLTGAVAAQIPHFVYHSKKGTPEKGVAPPPGTEEQEESHPQAEAILPNWPVMRTMSFTAKVLMSSLDYDDLNLKGVALNMALNGGTFNGKFTIDKVFGGGLKLENIQTQLLTPMAPLSAQVTLSQIDLAQAISWGAPKWKDSVKGLASGQIVAHLASHQSPRFVEDSKATGHLEIKNGFLSTVSFDQFLNEKLASIPGIGTKKVVNTKGTAMDVDCQFDFGGSQLVIKNLNAQTPAKDQLQASGVVKLDKTLDLKGKAYLASSPVSGDVAACNSDKSGRLVVPLHITGTATQPEYNLVDGTAQEMISQAARCQTEKLKNNLQNQINSRVQDEAKKSLMNLLGH